MTNYVEQDVKLSKIQEYTDLLGQISRALEKKSAGIDISEYEEQLLSNNYSDWMRIQTMLKDAEISQDIYEDFLQFPTHYLISDGEIVYNENWEAEEAQKEKERIAKLHLTRGDVFRGLLMAKGITRAQLRGMIEKMPEDTTEHAIAKEMALIDFDDSLNFYRGVALIDTLGEELGITPEQMTNFFETGDYHALNN